MLRRPGSSWGLVPCSRVSPQSWYWRWRKCWLFTPPTYNPCRTWDSNPQPSGYKSDSLSIRPRLPQFRVWWPILGICALHLTHPKCTQTAVNKHPEQWAAIYAVAPREQLGFGALLKGTSVVVLKVERVLYIHSPHLQFLPARDSNPTL